jgi:hypothetical protein
MQTSGNFSWGLNGSTSFATLDSTTHRPGLDNTQSSGNASFRWSVVYAATGTINTSDAREKTEVNSLSIVEKKAAYALACEIGSFQFLNAVAEKGESARLHIGMTVQRAIEILQNFALDPFSYAFICYDSWKDQFEDYSEIPANEEVLASPAEFEYKTIEEVVVIDGKQVPIERTVLTCIKEAVEYKPAFEGRQAYKKLIRSAGNRFGFRPDELTLFMFAGITAKLKGEI